MNDDLFEICNVEIFDGTGRRKQAALNILALIAVERDADQLLQKMEDILEGISKLSIGRALERLCSVADIPDEFESDEGPKDGIDALAYHLAGSQCTRSINALQRVLKRFDQRVLKRFDEDKFKKGPVIK